MTSPTVLLIEDQEWTARSIESILKPANFAVFKAYTGRQGLEIARKVTPDLVLVDLHLPDMSGEEVLGQLGDLPTIGATTPLVILSSGRVNQAERVSAFRQGAWDVFTPPLDPVELTLRIKTWVKAKREADKAREAGLVDHLTGTYNFNGLVQRVKEIVAESTRYERPLACIVLGEVLDRNGSSEEDAQSIQETEKKVASALRDVCRTSDAVGRIREREFIIVAPSTDNDGAAVLARRVLDALKDNGADPGIRAGVYSVQRSRREPLDLSDLLGPATASLRRAQAAGGKLFEHSFDEGEN
ncbi:response regulator [Gemmatimonadota bacterium]